MSRKRKYKNKNNFLTKYQILITYVLNLYDFLLNIPLHFRVIVLLMLDNGVIVVRRFFSMAFIVFELWIEYRKMCFPTQEYVHIPITRSKFLNQLYSCVL